MKYCPACGAVLPVEDARFCGICGKKIPGTNATIQRRMRKHKDLMPEPNELAADIGYDGYYDDVLPTDQGEIRKSLDREMLKKIILLGLAVLLILSLCVTVLVIL